MSEEDKHKLHASVTFRCGIEGVPVEQTEEEQQNLYGYAIVQLYGRFSPTLRTEISLEILSQAAMVPSEILDVSELLDSKSSDTVIVRTVLRFAKSNRKLVSFVAKEMLANLPDNPDTNPATIDGLISSCLLEAESVMNRGSRDQWQYAELLEQSYDTARRSALWSNATVRELNGDNVHFMMFRHGKSRVQCLRFSFGLNPMGTDPSAIGDPTAIDGEFCKLLQLPGNSTETLRIHAKRLELSQHVLKNINHQVIHTQELFQHFLGELVNSIDGDSFRVVDVTGMQNIAVFVEVCNQYLKQQGKPEESRGAGKRVPLKIKSDLVVTSDSGESSKLDQFLGCLYNIEMKDAFGLLRHSAIRPKSQLIAESLGRSIELKTTSGCPNALFSALCDCCSLYILVHFPHDDVAFLSHREVEPGRMVCVLAWLHKISKNSGLTLKEFRSMGFTIGDAFEKEIEDAQKKREAGGKGNAGNNQGAKKGDHKTQKMQSKKRSAATWVGEEMCLDLVASEELEAERERVEKLATFSAFQNYYRFGDPLPASDGVLFVHQKQEMLGKMTHYENGLARVGLR